VTLGTIKVLSLVVFIHLSSMNSNWGVSFHSTLVTITQYKIHYKTKVSHKHMVVIYHRNTPLPKVRKGLDGYRCVVFFFPVHPSMEQCMTQFELQFRCCCMAVFHKTEANDDWLIAPLIIRYFVLHSIIYLNFCQLVLKQLTLPVHYTTTPH
jgi:hypothetical protein